MGRRYYPPMERMGDARLAIAVAMAVLVGAPSAATAEATFASAGMMPAASAGDHLWFCAEVQHPHQGCRIYHVDAGQSPPAFTTVADSLILSQPPQALAAWGDQVWIVMHPKREQTGLRREVFTLQIMHNKATGIDYLAPHDRLPVTSDLSGLGRLAGVVGTSEGPVALLVPTQRDLAGVETDDHSAVTTPRLERPQLLQLAAGGWQPLALPEDLTSEPDAVLAAGGPRREWLLLLTSASDRSGSSGGGAVVHRRGRDGSWHATTAPLSLASVLGQTVAGAQTAVVTTVVGRLDDAAVVYLRDDAILPLVDFRMPAQRWAVLGAGDDLRLLEAPLNGNLTIRRIDGVSGAIGPEQPLRPQAHSAQHVLFLTIVLGVGLTVAVVAVLFKPSAEAAAVKLPPELRVAGPMLRLLAVMADLIPGALLAMLWLKVDLVATLRAPSFALSMSQALPALIAIGVAMVHGTISELLSGRTIGKLIFGTQVVRNDGGRPSPGAVLVRNLLKAMTLCIPPLAIFAFLNPNMKGIGETLTRTVVVTDADERQERVDDEVDDDP